MFALQHCPVNTEDSKKKLLQEWAKHRRVDIAGLELEDTKPLLGLFLIRSLTHVERYASSH